MNPSSTKQKQKQKQNIDSVHPHVVCPPAVTVPYSKYSQKFPSAPFELSPPVARMMAPCLRLHTTNTTTSPQAVVAATSHTRGLLGISNASGAYMIRLCVWHGGRHGMT